MAEKKDKKKKAPASAKAAADKPAPKVKVAKAKEKAEPKKKAAAPRPTRRPARTYARPRKERPEAAAAEPSASEESPAMPARASVFAGIHDLRPSPGATHSRKRVGRGPGSGHGKTAGRGNKGQKSRSGYAHQRGFEGGQMPLHRRVPKRGFTNIFRVEYDIVNISDLDRFDAGAAVTLEALAERRLARRSRPVKILGDGEIHKALTVSAHKFSAAARASIEAAGGSCEVIPR
jgi:large subunit ribosomal protein L15